ncbi:MAG: hypothetical protein JWN44_5945 [Myxococcales bacterium]|nr:hypothetical protein [Myxococcales bacterium]
MTHRAAALMVAVMLSSGATARGQPVAGVAGLGMVDVDPVPVEPALASESDDQPRPPPRGCCCCGFLPPAPSEHELTGMLAAGVSAAGVAYLFATVYTLTQPHAQSVDLLPVVGAIASAARSPLYDRSPPLLLFSAGVQAVGILVAVAVGAELASRRRLMIDVGASPCGAGVSVTWRH